MKPGTKFPKLRFANFVDEWESRRLDEIGTVIRGSSPRPQGDKRYYGGNIPRLMVSDVTRDGKYVTPRVDFLTEKGARLSRPCKAGTLTIVCSGTVGIPSFLAVDACIHDGFLALIDIDEKVSQDYVYHQLSTLRNKFERSATHGGVFTNLTTSGIKEFEIAIPSYSEQQKVAAFLSAVDERMGQLARKKEILLRYKKGVIQQIFGQNIRFKDDDGNDFPEWDETPLKEVLTERKTFSTKGKSLPHVSLTIEGVVPKSERYERDFLVRDDAVKEYKITRLNDICYNPANLKFGVIARNKLGDAIFSPIYITLEVVPTANDRFIEYLVVRKSFINKVRKYEEGTVYERMAVKPADFLRHRVAMPCLQEQRKIVAFLSVIDKKLDLLSEKLARTKSFKEGLLQQMFA